MKKRSMSKFVVVLLCLSFLVSALIGCSPIPASGQATPPVVEQTAVAAVTPNPVVQPTPKYVFLFIGDGMGFPQYTALSFYRGTVDGNFRGTKNDPTPDNPPKAGEVVFAGFPVSGIVNTYDGSKFITDSAAAATAFATGHKTLDGHLGMDVHKNSVKNISELAKDKGMKVGIISSVSLDHATPAGFYAHIESRKEYYEISKQLASSDIDFFGGGGLLRPTGANKDQPDVLELAKQNGYTVANTKEDILALNKDSGKTIAMSPDLEKSQQVINFVIDAKPEELTLADFVKKGIDVLENDKGFFMMVEAGKIDPLAHANDAASMLLEIQELELAVKAAMEFAQKHPAETLILVTADHEGGGLTIGYNSGDTRYDTHFEVFERQTMAYMTFAPICNQYRENKTSFKDAMQDVKETFGLILPDDPDAAIAENSLFVLSEGEVQRLKDGYAQSLIPPAERVKDEDYVVRYTASNYEPFVLEVTRILANKAGLCWTTTGHTGLPVPIFASGVGQEEFTGQFDNTEVFTKLVKLMGIG